MSDKKEAPAWVTEGPANIANYANIYATTFLTGDDRTRRIATTRLLSAALAASGGSAELENILALYHRYEMKSADDYSGCAEVLSQLAEALSAESDRMEDLWSYYDERAAGESGGKEWRCTFGAFDTIEGETS